MRKVEKKAGGDLLDARFLVDGWSLIWSFEATGNFDAKQQVARLTG